MYWIYNLISTAFFQILKTNLKNQFIFGLNHEWTCNLTIKNIFHIHNIYKPPAKLNTVIVNIFLSKYMNINYSFRTTPSHFQNQVPNNGLDYSLRAWVLFGVALLVASSNFRIMFVLIYIVCDTNLLQIKFPI